MDLPEVSPASIRALHQSEIVRWPTFPDLKPNSTLHALSCCTPLFAFPHLPQNDIPSKLRMGQDLLPHLSSTNTDRVNHALSVSANSPIWQSACNRLAHGMGRGIRRARQFDERSNSLAPRDIFRRVSPGLWRSRWPGFATAPSPRSKRQPHTTLGFIAARQTTTFYTGGQVLSQNMCLRRPNLPLVQKRTRPDQGRVHHSGWSPRKLTGRSC